MVSVVSLWRRVSVDGFLLAFFCWGICKIKDAAAMFFALKMSVTRF